MGAIIVKNQAELDKALRDSDENIYIKFGTTENPAVVKGSSTVTVCASFTIAVYDTSTVIACNNSEVIAYDHSIVFARDNSMIRARGSSTITVWNTSTVCAYGSSTVYAWDSSTVHAYSSSTIYAYNCSTVIARDNSTIIARDNSTITAWSDSKIYAWGNVQVVDRQYRGVIEVSGNARVVYDPKNIDEYINFYAVNHTGMTIKLFKAVHKRKGRFFSDWRADFEYKIGEVAIADSLDKDLNEVCGHGIHMAYLDWCLDYGSIWDDLAILEVEVLKDEVIVPNFCNGKIRAKSVKVIREVPLRECGVFGEILEKKQKGNNSDSICCF